MIYIDDREPEKIQKMAQNYLDNVEVVHLEVGDLVHRDTVVEIKRGSDFGKSLNDGRLENQILHMELNFKNVYVGVVGSDHKLFNDDFTDLSPHRYNSFMVDCLERGVKFIRVRNNDEFFRTAKNIFKYARGEKCQVNELKKVAPRTDDRYVGIIMAGVEGIGPNKAREILKSFKVWELFEASERDLQSVKGIGKVQAKKIKEVFKK